MMFLVTRLLAARTKPASAESVLPSCARLGECCWEGSFITQACDDPGACGCKVVRHSAHSERFVPNS